MNFKLQATPPSTQEFGLTTVNDRGVLGVVSLDGPRKIEIGSIQKVGKSKAGRASQSEQTLILRIAFDCSPSQDMPRLIYTYIYNIYKL